MKYTCLIIFCWIFANYFQCKELVMIQETFRHGAKYPKSKTLSKIINSTFILGQSEELTTQGKSMHYLLGKAIYQQYWKTLFGGTPYEKIYNQSQIYVKSTNSNRTIQSAQSHLLGLLEKLEKLELGSGDREYSTPAWNNLKEEQKVEQKQVLFKSSPAYHPIAVHVQKEGSWPQNEGDFLIGFKISNCPNQKFWQAQNEKSEQLWRLKKDPKIKNAFEELSQASGVQITIESLNRLVSDYHCLKFLGYHSSLKQLLQSQTQVSNLLNFVYIYHEYLKLFSQKIQIKAIASNYFKQTLQNLEGSIKGEFTPKIVIYSAHRPTIQMILYSMNFTNLECIADHYLNGAENQQWCQWRPPQFSANIIFQLWNNNGEYSIKILYNGNVRKIPICGYKLQCTFSEFKEWVNDFVLEDVRSVCGVSKEGQIFYPIIFLLVSLILLLAVYMGLLKVKIGRIDTIEKARKEGYIVNFEQEVKQERK